MQMKQVAFAAAVALASLSASAATSTFIDNGGVHELAEFGSNSFTSLATLDIYNFTLGTAVTSLMSDVASVPVNPVFALTGTISLWNDTTNTLVGSYAFTDVTTSFGALTAGQYHYTVTASGPVGGSYSFGSYITPVPEPETYALMLAGLGVMGFVARRRKS